jgi:NAD(P)-dependent dehydrogenase (short-subunit alcohol dehydrogenase family)/phosphopantetheinyl transferase/acyl carrier protein
VLDVLLGVISEKTGYDREELELDYELEADLGIDTVKQAEIFAEVRERFGVERDEDFSLADYPTISALAGWLNARIPGAAPPDAAPALAEVFDDEEVTAPMALSAPASGAQDANASAGGVPELLPEDPLDLPDGFQLRRPIWTPRALSAPLRRLQGRSVRVLGVGPIAAAIRREVELRGGAERERPEIVVDAGAEALDAFALARQLDERPPSDWICLTLYGDTDEAQHAAFEGARAGLTKALGCEWSGCRARTLDLPPSLGAEGTARVVCDELERYDGTVEIRLNGEQREAMALVREPSPARGGRVDEQVIVVTGGARGVTARVAIELAKRGAAALVIAGRSAPGREPLDEAAARQEIRTKLKAAGERATPASVDRELAPLRRAEEARRSLAEMRAAGASVSFRRCDMADPEEVRAMIEVVLAEHGQIDGCVHGAGVEESRPLADKDETAWRRVYEGKAVGGVALAEGLPEDAWLLSMGSVAGRFGNAGQVDYSAANEAMAQVCRARPRSLHVDWTAWDDVGMAVRGGMKHLLTSRGVQLLPAEAGASLAVDLMTAGVSGELVVAGALGEMERAPHPLLDSESPDGAGLVARRSLSLESDGWITDHSIGGVPVLPGVIGVEMMVAAARQLAPSRQVLGLTDVRFERPLKLYRGEPAQVEVSARLEGDHRVRCALRTRRAARTGRVLETVHFSGTVLSPSGDSGVFEVLPLQAIPSSELEAGEIYRRFFHGPIFQVIQRAEAVSAEGLLASGRVDHSPLGAGLLTGPLALELAFQAAGLHRMITEGVMALPAGFDALYLVRPLDDEEPLNVSARRRPEGDYDVDVVGESGLVMALRGFRLVDTGPLPDGDALTVPGWSDAEVATARVGEPAGEALDPGERASLEARGTPARVAQRVAGRLAAKRAVSALTGAPLSSIRVHNRDSGEPYVEIDGAPGPRVSITHSGERAAAVASHARVGVDLETIAARHPSFAREWFSEAERARWAADPAGLTAAWCVKEAVLKALGEGMALNPREIEVLSLDGDVAVALSGDVAARHRSLGGALEVRVLSADGAQVLVGARLAS